MRVSECRVGDFNRFRGQADLLPVIVSILDVKNELKLY